MTHACMQCIKGHAHEWMVIDQGKSSPEAVGSECEAGSDGTCHFKGDHYTAVYKRRRIRLSVCLHTYLSLSLFFSLLCQPNSCYSSG